MIDFLTLKKPDRPNHFLACTDSHCMAAKYDMVAPMFDLPLGDVKAAWQRVIDRQPRVEQVEISADGWQIDYVQRSRLFRFADHITVCFAVGEGAGEGSVDATRVLVFSRAETGYFDFGVNRKRVQTWLEELSREIAGHTV